MWEVRKMQEHIFSVYFSNTPEFLIIIIVKSEINSVPVKYPG